jgi:hypothetical protein
MCRGNREEARDECGDRGAVGDAAFYRSLTLVAVG